MRKHPNSHREAKATAPVLDSTRLCTHDRGSERKRLVTLSKQADNWLKRKVYLARLATPSLLKSNEIALPAKDFSSHFGFRRSFSVL